MNPRSFLIALLPFALLACQPQDSADRSKTADIAQPDVEAVARINGEPISRQDFDAYLASKQLSEPETQHDPDTVLNEMINMELIKQEAIGKGIHQRDDVRAELETHRTNLLVNTLVSERVDDLSFSEQELRKEYDRQIAEMEKQEYKARHILVQTKKEAREIIGRLEGGEDFVALAVEESIDPAGPEGGDLGWFHPNAMVPPFASAVQQLEKGEYTKQPVKTQYGWHVILLEDTRSMQPPAFKEVKDRLEGILVNQALQNYLDQLRAKAAIEIERPPASE